mgnify:CR=1 FL=1
MAKFAKPTDDDDPPAPVERAAPAAPAPSVVVVDNNNNNSGGMGGNANYMAQQATAQAQATASVGLAETAIDKEIVDQQVSKEQEHWMKAYWRPAMGWLYMAICACDFVVFPVISMFMPVFIKGMTYVPWKSITLDNGGLIHLAFGAILGVTAYGRTLEKKSGTN